MQGSKQEDIFEQIDSLYQSTQAQITSGMSPALLTDDLFSWMNHLMSSPGKLLKLATYPFSNMQSFIKNAMDQAGPCGGKDRRFASEGWKVWPWRFYAESFLATENYWQEATRGIPGLDEKVERAVHFQVRQILDALAPMNFPATNPDIIKETFDTGGMNWIKGASNALEDKYREMTGKQPVEAEGFEVGKNLAVTKGKVVLRTRLLELIQYEPTTKEVCKEPVLILPAWIMKYYILDLSPKNSLVKWLLEQGHTVFIGSWHNPTSEDRDMGMDDYFRMGAMAAIDAVSTIIPNTKIHLAGYCLGGTLALITAAAMARDGDDRLATLTLLAAQGDFTEAGEITLFLREGQIKFLESLMQKKGYLDSSQMAGAFKMLRSYELYWSKIINEYLMGQRSKMIDLMVWNSDATKMPYKMHSEYLEKLFLHNDFVEGRLTIEGKPVAAENIKVPVFAVGTEKDHVVPWPSAHKIHLMVNTSVTFVLTNSGHNAGIVSEPGHRGRYYRILERKPGDPYLNPANWLTRSELNQSKSWWSAWRNWIADHSSPDLVNPPAALGTSGGPYAPICDAPGTYVFEK
ncbi:MAG: alpha/beta fold hydrolase [Bdellovibrionales bacterium]|jgi:polyhydroxyalkanoate synthase